MKYMSQELFDIFDENNIAIGVTKPRDEVHSGSSYWHRVTHAWIISQDQKILCQKRSDNKDSDPGKWQSFFGGHLSSGDTYEHNAIRELTEELGLKLKESDLNSVYILKDANSHHFAQIFTVLIDKDTLFKFNDDEVTEVSWFSVERLKKEINNRQFCNGIDERVMQLGIFE